MGLFWMIDGTIQKDRPITIPQSRPAKLERDPEQLVVTERGLAPHSPDPSEQVTVSQVMTREVMTLTVRHTVDDALNMMEEFGFNHVPIVDAMGRMAGIVSDRDLLRSMDFVEEPLKDHMTGRVVVARPSTFLKDAARALMAEKISSLPVVGPDLEPVGLVTMADVLGYLVSHPAMELWS